jgi:crossover junction endodeoxyribonuclease RuvC
VGVVRQVIHYPMKLLSIDPSLTTGWCIREGAAILGSGVWKIGHNPRFESIGMRWLRFQQKLNEAYAACPYTHVAYEEVRFHRGGGATAVYEGLVSHLQSWCERIGVTYQAIPVKTIKKYACGNGNADKSKMIAAAKVKWPHIEIVDDNHADALWIGEIIMCSLTSPVEAAK